MNKKCFKCNKIKPLEEFAICKPMKDGHLNKCKACGRKDSKEYYQSPEGRAKKIAYDKMRSQTPERKAKMRIYKENRKKNHPRREKAWNKTSNYIAAGKLIKQPCQVCGEEKVEAHHEDYRRPLDVMWFCRYHHTLHHGRKPWNSNLSQDSLSNNTLLS